MARVLLLSAKTSYRTEEFARAAERLGVEATLGTDRCRRLATIWDREAFGSIELPLAEVSRAAARIVAEARATPWDAIVASDDMTAEVAALAARALGLVGNDPEAARRARNKRLLREALAAGGVPQPRQFVFDENDEPARIAVEVEAQLGWPVVLKPLLCSASRGVIRADDRASFEAAWRRIAALLRTPALRAVDDPDGHRIAVEEFVPGPEVAVEGLLTRGAFTLLAIFDKPDPLDGPFFEETIYTTPSRHPPAVQEAIVRTTAAAARALGLVDGPIHAELRLGAPRSAAQASAPTIIEVAARSIGGLCARTLRFGLGAQSLEELVILAALGRPIDALVGEAAARAPAGVMMIPIPKGGVFQAVDGIEAARAVPLVEDVVVTARPGQVLVPLPEGQSYLGFVFARGGEGPAAVEAALRAAHACLRFEVTPTLTPAR
jgi:biotin carboxylase